ncbi:uncharacterized protein LOC117551010 isoform X2 [Gymnodraco acuticeps]|uniref:Uncharacterized protein LOC117551010 isoform X2 n=1 Tax=Gymnodraco acuticeps TaxID=8218 RepID=A0A6P8V2X1_GYMAC|nr:uncharacterized protein LOC117551010 isoform X2 [Gymnodraco acuticeps]
MAERSSPAEVNLTCFYLHVYPSPESDVSSVFIRTLLPPTLTVNPPVITETDSVTLHCQTPPSVSVSQCYFYTLSGGVFPCLKTLKGTELLEKSQQRSPAEVQMKCFYTLKLGGIHYPSPHSDTSSITVRSLPVTSVSTPVTPLTSGRTVYTPSISESSSSSPLTQVKPTPETLTSVNPAPDQDITGSSVTMAGIKDSSNTAAPQKTASAGLWKFVAVVAGCGVTVGVILLVSGILCNNRRTAGSEEVKGRQEHHNENMETYHMYAAITEEPAASDLKSIMYSTVQSH